MLMSKKRQYATEAIDKALQFIANKESSIREGAKQFGVPKSSFWYKIQNLDTKLKSEPDPVLTEAE